MFYMQENVASLARGSRPRPKRRVGLGRSLRAKGAPAAPPSWPQTPPPSGCPSGAIRRDVRSSSGCLPFPAARLGGGLGGRGCERGGRRGGRRRSVGPSRVGRRIDPLQIGDSDEAKLAREGHRPVAALLLREAREPMLAGVVHGNAAAVLDREAALLREKGVSHVVLGAGGGRSAEVRRPPSAGGAGARRRTGSRRSGSATASLWRRAAGSSEGRRVRCRARRHGFQALIEHVADHDHSAVGPLSHAAEIGMIELRLTAAAVAERADQATAASRLTPWRLAASATSRRPSGVSVCMAGLRQDRGFARARARALAACRT